MSNTCGGSDASVQGEIEEVLKKLIKKTSSRQYLDQGDKNDDGTYSCLLEDLQGTRCPKGTCRYNHDEKPISGYTPKKPLP